MSHYLNDGEFTNQNIFKFNNQESESLAEKITKKFQISNNF